jgi:hypothetical protein
MDTEIAMIKDSIFEFRGVKVMLDVHLAQRYGVQTRSLKQAVRRNIERFPKDFMFELTLEEFEDLRLRVANLPESDEPKTGKHAKYLPFAFTELGVSMLSSVLRSEKAIEVNINIMRTFVMLRQFAMGLNELWDRITAIEHEMGIKFKDIFEALHLLIGGNGGRTIVKGFQAFPKQLAEPKKPKLKAAKREKSAIP